MVPYTLSRGKVKVVDVAIGILTRSRCNIKTWESTFTSAAQLDSNKSNLSYFQTYKPQGTKKT